MFKEIEFSVAAVNNVCRLNLKHRSVMKIFVSVKTTPLEFSNH